MAFWHEIWFSLVWLLVVATIFLSINTFLTTVLVCRPQTQGEEELQLQLALAMSREEADAEETKKKSDDMRLSLAIQKSKEEREAEAKAAGQVCPLLIVQLILMGPHIRQVEAAVP